MSSSTSSRSTLTMTPSTMSPSLKYLIVWSIAARKSSAEPMSLIAIWGVVLSGRTWVEVMWLVAPDGGCVGTGRPAAGVTAGSGESRRAPFPQENPAREQHTRPLAHSHGTDRGAAGATGSRGPPPGGGRAPAGGRAGGRGGACPVRLFMTPPPPLPLGGDGYPAAGGVLRRPAGA